MKIPEILSTLLATLPVTQKRSLFLRFVNPYTVIGGIGAYAAYKAYQDGFFDPYIEKFKTKLNAATEEQQPSVH